MESYNNTSLITSFMYYYFLQCVQEYCFEYGTKEVIGNKDRTCVNCGMVTGISLIKDHFCETCGKVGHNWASKASSTHIEIVVYHRVR